MKLTILPVLGLLTAGRLVASDRLAASFNLTTSYNLTASHNLTTSSQQVASDSQSKIESALESKLDYSKMHSLPGWKSDWITNGDFLGWSTAPSIPRAPPSVICNSSITDKSNYNTWLGLTDKTLKKMYKKIVYCDLKTARSNYVTIPSLDRTGKGGNKVFALAMDFYRRAKAARSALLNMINTKDVKSGTKLPQYVYDFDIENFVQTKNLTANPPLSEADVFLGFDFRSHVKSKRMAPPHFQLLPAAGLDKIDLQYFFEEMSYDQKSWIRNSGEYTYNSNPNEPLPGEEGVPPSEVWEPPPEPGYGEGFLTRGEAKALNLETMLEEVSWSEGQPWILGIEELPVAVEEAIGAEVGTVAEESSMAAAAGAGSEVSAGTLVSAGTGIVIGAMVVAAVVEGAIVAVDNQHHREDCLVSGPVSNLWLATD